MATDVDRKAAGARPRPKVLQISAELALLILSYIPDDAWRSTCRSLTLTCQSWSQVTHPLLYNDVEMDGAKQKPQAPEILCNTIRLRQDLTGCIRSVQMKNVNHFNQASTMMPKLLTKLMEHASNFSSLTLQIVKGQSKVLAPLAVRGSNLSQRQGAQLKDITVYGPAARYDTTETGLLHVPNFSPLARIPTVERATILGLNLVRLGHLYSEVKQGGWSNAPLAQNLQNLEIDLLLVLEPYEHLDGFKSKFDWPIALAKMTNSFRQLKSLSSDGSRAKDAFDRHCLGEAIRSLSPTLDNLKLRLPPKFSPDDRVDNIRTTHGPEIEGYQQDSIGSLATLQRLRWLHVDFGELLDVSGNLVIAKVLPDTLQDLYLDRVGEPWMMYNPNAAVTDLLSGRRSKLPYLCKLSFRLDDLAWEPDEAVAWSDIDWNWVSETCIDAGVEFTLMIPSQTEVPERLLAINIKRLSESCSPCPVFKTNR